MPPEAPASGMVWRTRRRAVSTMRMSLAPWPADTVHRNRPSAVTAPPVGKLPRPTCAPCGVSWRPLSRNPVAGSGALGAAFAGATQTTTTSATSASAVASAADSASVDELPHDDPFHDRMARRPLRRAQPWASRRPTATPTPPAVP